MKANEEMRTVELDFHLKFDHNSQPYFLPGCFVYTIG